MDKLIEIIEAPAISMELKVDWVGVDPDRFMDDQKK